MGVLPESLPLISRTSELVKETTTGHQANHYDYPADSLVYAVLPGFMIGIATVAAALRIWTRARILRRLTVDDWLLLIAQVLAVATFALWLYARAVERNYAPESSELLEKTAWVCIIIIIGCMPHLLTDCHSRSLLASCYTSPRIPRSKCHAVFSSCASHKAVCKGESTSAPWRLSCYAPSSPASSSASAAHRSVWSTRCSMTLATSTGT